MPNSSSIQTLLSVSELHRINAYTLADSTAGRELHPALKIFSFSSQAYHVPCALSRKDKYATLYSVGLLLGTVVSEGMVADGFFNPCTVPLAAVSVISPPMIWFLYTSKVAYTG